MRLKLYILCLLFSFTTKIDAQIPPHLDCVKINHLYRKACHNCYEPNVNIPTLITAIDETQVIELDIHSHDRNTTEAPMGVWYVRHSSQGTNSNNVNNCISQFNGQSNQDFNICLENVQQWSIAHPGHDPIIVFIDLKGPNTLGGGDFWRPNHGTTDLDNVLKDFAMDMGGLDVLYKPSDLQGSFSQARFAAINENWPSLGNMKNKFMFVLTGENDYLNEYLTNVGSGAMAFVAVGFNGANPTLNELTYPADISISNLQHIVFYNFEDNQAASGTNFIPDNGYMSRSWQGGNTTQSQYGGSIAAKVNNIAIKNIYANNLNTYMNYQLIGINNIVVGGTSSSPQYIKSVYNSILQSALVKVTAQNLIVEAGTTYNIRAGEEVDLLPGTDIQMGANTDISIGTCVDYASNLRTTNPTPTNIESNTEQELIELAQAPLVYPNPAKDFVYIDYSNNTNTVAIVNLFDITGRLIKTVTSNENNQTFSININELNEGTYFYTLQVGETIYNGKMLKIKP